MRYEPKTTGVKNPVAGDRFVLSRPFARAIGKSDLHGALPPHLHRLVAWLADEAEPLPEDHPLHGTWQVVRMTPKELADKRGVDPGAQSRDLMVLRGGPGRTGRLVGRLTSFHANRLATQYATIPLVVPAVMVDGDLVPLDQDPKLRLPRVGVVAFFVAPAAGPVLRGLNWGKESPSSFQMFRFLGGHPTPGIGEYVSAKQVAKALASWNGMRLNRLFASAEWITTGPDNPAISGDGLVACTILSLSVGQAQLGVRYYYTSISMLSRVTETPAVEQAGSLPVAVECASGAAPVLGAAPDRSAEGATSVDAGAKTVAPSALLSGVVASSAARRTLDGTGEGALSSQGAAGGGAEENPSEHDAALRAEGCTGPDAADAAGPGSGRAKTDVEIKPYVTPPPGLRAVAGRNGDLSVLLTNRVLTRFGWEDEDRMNLINDGAECVLPAPENKLFKRVADLLDSSTPDRVAAALTAAVGAHSDAHVPGTFPRALTAHDLAAALADAPFDDLARDSLRVASTAMLAATWDGDVNADDRFADEA